MTSEQYEAISVYINAYYNRLVITLLRNGIVFKADIRDRKKWMKELLKWNETAVLTDYGEPQARDVLIQALNKAGYSSTRINSVLMQIDNIELDKSNIHVNRKCCGTNQAGVSVC